MEGIQRQASGCFGGTLDGRYRSDELSLSVLRGISSGIDHEEKEEDGFTDRLTVKIV